MNLKKFPKRLLAVIPILMAILIVGALVRNRKGPEQFLAKEKITPVRIIKIQPIDVAPRAVGYGYVQPDRFWQAVAEVSGKIVSLSSLLERGELIKDGTELARIDPAPYELAEAQIESDIQNIKAQISEIGVTKKNQRLLFGIEEKNLALSRKELERQRQLVKKRIVSESSFDNQQAAYYAQLTKVQSLKNSLNLIPAKIKALTASLSLNEVRLEAARLDLENTVIKAPFNCRIVDVKIEQSQFVQEGQVLFSADGTASAEIEAQVSIDKMINLLRSVGRPVSIANLDFSVLSELFQLSAVVRLKVGDVAVSWNARFVRAAGSLDPKARTVGVIVAVDYPYEKVRIGSRPPLVRNMYCEVELIGQPIPNMIVIPRSALHDRYVFILDSRNRLVRKEVALDFAQGNFYAVKDGLKEGDRLIVSDLIPAIEGMRVDPHEDTVLAAKLSKEASAKTESREISPENR